MSITTNGWGSPCITTSGWGCGLGARIRRGLKTFILNITRVFRMRRER